jgi:DNA end-binding protein Ku
MHVVALIHHEGDAFGVSFPDFPGCTTVATDLESAVAKAAEVLAFHAEGLAEDGPLPRPRGLSELNSDHDFLQDNKDALLVLVPYEPPSRAVRINMTVEESLLARIDRAAEAIGETRSRYFATSARLRMGTMEKRSIIRSSSSSSKDVLADIEPTGGSASWKGYLKLSLVSCPIAIHPAFSDVERISFKPINLKTGSRLNRQFIDAETGEPVAREDIGRGYELRKNEYLPVEDDELNKIQIASRHTIDIASFVPRAGIDIRDIDNTYYVVPLDDTGQEAFAVIREAMRSKDMLGIGHVVLAQRERPIALGAFGKGMRAMTLRYPYEVRNADEYFADIPDIHVPDDMRILAEHILESKATNFDPSHFEDGYESALIEMLNRRQAGVPTPKPAVQPRSPSNVINLIDALRRSIKSPKRKQSGSLKNARRS